MRKFNKLFKIIWICSFMLGLFIINSSFNVSASTYEEIENDEISNLSTQELVEIIIEKEIYYVDLFSTIEMGANKFKVNNEYYIELVNRNNANLIINQMLDSNELTTEEVDRLNLLYKILNDYDLNNDINSNINTRSVTNIYTPNGTAVQYIRDNADTEVLTEEKILYYHDLIVRNYSLSDSAYIAPANSFYNCHSYAFYSQDTNTNNIWIEYPYSYLDDYSYVEVDTVRPGDIICYVSHGSDENTDEDDEISHSAIVYSGSATIPEYDQINEIRLDGVSLISKFGPYGVYIHGVNECPYGHSDSTFKWIKAYRPRTNATYNLSINMNDIVISRSINSNGSITDRYGMYELNAVTSDYLIDISSNNSLDVRLYNVHMNLVSMELLNYDTNTNMYNYTTTLSEGIYYLRVSFVDINNSGIVLINISPHSHLYTDHYEMFGTVNHTSYCECGDSILENHHYDENGLCNYCDYLHVHTFNEWKYKDEVCHIEKCICGRLGSVTQAHYISVDDIGKTRAFCLGCHARLDLTGDIAYAPTPYNLAIKVSINGSYILPNGIVVLQEIDLESYENGTLVFYDKDKLLQVS